MDFLRRKILCEKRDGSIQKPNLSKTNILQEMTIVTSKNQRNQKLKDLIKR